MQEARSCKKQIRCLSVLVATAVAALSLNAKSLYVSQKKGSNSYNGLSSDKPKFTIQAAINAAATGDVIYVGPGVYGEDEGLQNKDHWWGTGRIHITSKGLCLVATDGPDVTHIVGKRADTESGYSAEGTAGYGNDAARCIIVQNASTNRPVVIKGFTIRDGYTNDRPNAPSGRGGALMDSADGSGSDHGAFLVDCVISNCQGAATQLAVGGTFVRCRIQDNVFRKGANCGNDTVYVYSGGTRFLNCLFWHNKTVDDTGTLGDLSTYWTSGGRLVNCTIADNRSCFYAHSTAYFYNNLYAVTRYRTDDGGKYENHIRDVVSTRMMMSPTTGDIRLREGTSAVAAGDAAYIGGGDSRYFGDATIVPMPDVDRLGLDEEFRIDPYVDLYGNPVPKTGAIAVGAVQETAVPAAGAIYAPNERVVFGDKTFANYAGYAEWFWPSNYPCSVKVGVIPPEGMAVWGFSISGHGTGLSAMRFPPYNSNSAWFVPPPSPSTEMQVSYSARNNVKWVDASNAADGAQDGTTNHPYATIQDAIEALGENTVAATEGIVFVRPGVYSTGGGTAEFSDASVNARVQFGVRRVRLVSTDGPEKTVIVGAPDPSTADGCGSNAYMTIAMGAQGAVQGFTLTGGYSGPGASLASGRGSLYSYGRDLHVTDCIITNNFGRNSAIGTARFERCLITGNTGGNSVFYAPMLVSCLVGGNTITGDTGYFVDDNWADHPGLIVGTTLVGDGVHHAFDMLSVNSRRVNSIIARGGRMKRPNDSYQYGMTVGCLYSGFLDYVGGGFMVADPMLRSPLAAAEEEDFAVYSLSPAFSAAVAPGEDAANAWWYLCPSDYRGNPWRFDASGRPVAGALQETFSGGVYVAGGNGGMTVEGGSVGYNDLSDGETLSVGIERGSSRPIAGFAVNGETNLFAKGDVPAVTVTKEAGVDLVVSPILSNVWYVDAVDGSDEDNTGYNPASAFKTLACALSNPFVFSGDTVKAMPGEYADGEMKQSASALLASRAVVWKGVTLESTDGAAATTIRGRASDIETVPSGASYKALAAGLGMGTNAVRCVYVENGGVVRGFTLADGHTRGFMADGSANHGDENYNGGGAAGSGTLERCVLRGGAAFRGGGVKNTTCVDCVFDGNVSIYAGGASSDANVYGCLSKNNVCKGNEKWGGFFYWTACEGCTVMDWLGSPNGKSRVVKNTLVTGCLGQWDSGNPGPTNFVNCAIATDVGGWSPPSLYGNIVAAGDGCIATNSAALAVYEDGRPVVGSNVAIDKGDATLLSKLSDTDLSGAQRVYNGQIDIGALEGDWRVRYGRDICPRASFSVDEADSCVEESQSGTVLLPPGGTLSATWQSPDAKRIVKARVTGTGVLAVQLGEDVREVTAADGLQEIVFPAENEATGLAFAYSSVEADAGYAELIGARPDLGMILLLR